MILEQHIIDAALNDIENQYKIVDAPIFFSALSDNNWKTEFYNKLKALRKNVFENEERIVVVQDVNDQYHYEDSSCSPGEMLVFLQQTLQEIDITNFFVLIVSPNPEIGNEIDTLYQEWSSDETKIQYYKVNGDYKKEIVKQDTFCVLPWMHFFLSTNGDVLPCCVSDKNLPIGNINKFSLEEIFNGEQIKKIRTNMMNNQKSLECKNCYYEEEQRGLKSKRQITNEKWKKNIPEFLQKTDMHGQISKIDILEFHLGLNSVCNLMCRTCSGFSSTRLALEEKKLFNHSKNYKQILTLKEKNNIVERVSPHIKTAKEIIFAGGEPTIQDEHYKILDQLIENKQQHTINLRYNLNFTTTKFKNKSIIDYWSKFSNIVVNASLDGHGKKFEYIRHGAKWKEVQKNFKKIKLRCPHILLEVNSVISFLSIESVLELQRVWHDTGILSINNFKIGLMVENSGFFDIQSLPKHHKKRLSKKIDEHCMWLKFKNNTKLLNDWLSVKEYMNFSDKTYLLSETKKDCEIRDKSRGVNFYKTFPELADVFDLD